MSATLTIRLDSDLKQKLSGLADATQRSKSYLAAKAIQEFVELNEWQVQEIKTAVAEADKGEFASDQLVAETFAKWGVSEG